MKVIEVVPNPYIALDRDGIPQGVVGAGMPGLFIGAQFDLVASQKTGKSRFFFPPNKDGSLTRRVHLSGDILTAIHAGELLVANEADAQAVGIVGKYDPKTGRGFMEPEKALAAEKAKALVYWQALKAGPDGKPDTSAKVGDIPREPTPLPDGESLLPETATKQITPSVKLTKNTEA